MRNITLTSLCARYLPLKPGLNVNCFVTTNYFCIFTPITNSTLFYGTLLATTTVRFIQLRESFPISKSSFVLL